MYAKTQMNTQNFEKHGYFYDGFRFFHGKKRRNGRILQCWKLHPRVIENRISDVQHYSMTLLDTWVYKGNWFTKTGNLYIKSYYRPTKNFNIYTEIVHIVRVSSMECTYRTSLRYSKWCSDHEVLYLKSITIQNSLDWKRVNRNWNWTDYCKKVYCYWGWLNMVNMLHVNMKAIQRPDKCYKFTYIPSIKCIWNRSRKCNGCRIQKKNWKAWVFLWWI